MKSRRCAVVTERLNSVLIVAEVLAIFAGFACFGEASKLLAQQPAKPAAAKSEATDRYRIGRTDVLEIVPVKLVPKSPYHFEVGDQLNIYVMGTIPDAPINVRFPVHTDGTVYLGFAYRSVRAVGLTVVEAQRAIEEHLRSFIRDPHVTVSLGSVPDRRSIAGEHVVGSDGTITLGVFGAVDVAGLTLAEARVTVEEKLAKSYEAVELWVRLRENNSHFYHVVLSHPRNGIRVKRVKYDGNATVLDAIAQLEDSALIHRVRLSRPGKSPHALTVEWASIIAGILDTNHKLQAGDVVIVEASAP